MESKPGKVNPSETELWNCENAFDFVCPRRWESLKHTESADIRYCDACSQNVYFCETPLEFVRQGNLGRCVAIRKEVTPGDVYTDYRMGGRPANPELRQAKCEREKDWWKAVLALDPTFNAEQIDEIRSKFEPLK